MIFSAFAQENKDNCLELIKPKDFNELKKLRLCLKRIKDIQDFEKANKIILNSFEGSKKLTDKFNSRKNSYSVESE